MKKIILLFIFCITCTAYTINETQTITHDTQTTSKNNRVKQKITLAKLRTHFIKNPHQNLLLTIVLSLLSYYPIKNILEYINYDITLHSIDDPFDHSYRMDLIKLSHITPSILFFSKLFYDNYQTKKYISRQESLIAKLKKNSTITPAELKPMC